MLVESPSKADSFWSAFPTVLWVFLLLIALILLRKELQELLRNISWRLRTGTAVKLFSFELGQSYVPQTFNTGDRKLTLEHRTDADGSRWEQRKQYYEPNRNVHVVHRLAPSASSTMLYDIQIYLVPHKDATLANVSRVEYYFGRHWENQIFTSIDRSQGFLITTSAYGQFMCTAKLFFTDGETVFINRYIDFEMGVLGTTLGREAPRKAS
jgi:hypothetical protein